MPTLKHIYIKSLFEIGSCSAIILEQDIPPDGQDGHMDRHCTFLQKYQFRVIERKADCACLSKTCFLLRYQTYSENFAHLLRKHVQSKYLGHLFTCKLRFK